MLITLRSSETNVFKLDWLAYAEETSTWNKLQLDCMRAKLLTENKRYAASDCFFPIEKCLFAATIQEKWFAGIKENWQIETKYQCVKEELKTVSSLT